MRIRFLNLVVVTQFVIFLAHWVLYVTWNRFWAAPDARALHGIQLALIFLSITFISASFLAFRYSNPLVRLFYTISAVWAGILNFLFFAALSCWIFYGLARVFGLRPNKRELAVALFGLAITTGIYGVINAACTRTKRVIVRLPNLPASWRGRTATLICDLHLGPVWGRGFMRRIVAKINCLQPDMVLIGGDLYDGTAANATLLADPLSQLSAPLGSYFVTGNHEEFSDHTAYLNAVSRAGVRVLNNEKLVVDGLQIAGVYYRDSVNAHRFRAVLGKIAVNRECASILLVHSPNRLTVAAEEGFSLQLSGHTHCGQFYPYTWIASRIYGPYVYGLQRLGNMQVYTTSGAGTWGPPLRVGSKAEIVLLQFE